MSNKAFFCNYKDYIWTDDNTEKTSRISGKQDQQEIQLTALIG